ncbi:hypothetical protein [Pelosinus fermentans]|uniref:Uncharacterized protein n=1 Tax=Pelosinus fermentans JBW45 TaxID=1192197 RepID=I8TSZ5_9FIRM|nr:hypothetical protein [Pelosinus fermentans]AJQ29002.1 hypothetical protein JBW_03665 [Pelosinus fermentans JBW45]
MLSTTESQIFAWAAGVILAVNVLAVVLHFLYKALSDSPLRDFIRSVIFELDRLADNMENSEKRRAAIQQICEILGWRKVLIPAVLVGWIIDAEVAAIRRMQQSANTPDFHEEDQ